MTSETKPITDEERAEWKRACEDATPGPWEAEQWWAEEDRRYASGLSSSLLQWATLHNPEALECSCEDWDTLIDVLVGQDVYAALQLLIESGWRPNGRLVVVLADAATRRGVLELGRLFGVPSGEQLERFVKEKLP